MVTEVWSRLYSIGERGVLGGERDLLALFSSLKPSPCVFALVWCHLWPFFVLFLINLFLFAVGSNMSYFGIKSAIFKKWTSVKNLRYNFMQTSSIFS